MKITCKYSGVTFRVEHLPSFTFVDQHPVFNMSARNLLVRAGNWSSGALSETDSKLLFLALLNKTDSVLWDCVANPSPRTVASNMQALFKLVGDADLIADGTIILPRFRISSDNSDLTSVHNWISKWFEAKHDWLAPAHFASRRQKSEARGMVLDKLISNPFKKSEQYAGRLASWAMIMGDVPTGLHEYWTRLFKLRDNEIFAASLKDLEELLDHMECNLYSSIGHMSAKDHGIADKILEHLRGIIKRARGGKIGDLMDGDFFSIIDDETKEEKLVATNATEQYNMKLAAVNAPRQEPKITDPKYAGKIGLYVKDKSAWQLNQTLLNQTLASVVSKPGSTLQHPKQFSLEPENKDI